MSTTIAIIIVLIIALIAIVGAVFVYKSMSADSGDPDRPSGSHNSPNEFVIEPTFVDGPPTNPKMFRYINIKQNSLDKRLRLAELRIFDDKGRNITKIAELFAPKGDVSSLRNDNINEILFDSGASYDYPIGNYQEPYLSIDLLNDYNIESMMFLNSDGSLHGAEVTLTNSEKSYTEMYVLNGTRDPRLIVKPAQEKPEPAPAPIAPDSRYIEIRRNVTNESMMKFAELQVWAKTAEGDTVNVARTATVTVNRGNAQALIDADLENIAYDSGPHKDRDGPYIHVDLGTEYDLSSIEFVNTAYPISGASVRVYNTDESKSAYYTVGPGNNPIIKLE